MAKATKKDIGKGIRALLANIETENKNSAADQDTSSTKEQPTAEIPIDQVEANPFQPRTEFDDTLLQELKESIETFGVIQPITVRRLNAGQYQIISGERRWRASQLAGLKAIPAYIREADDQGMLEMALLENIQRADLNPLEVAISYQRLIDECDLTHEELSNRLGKKRSSISNHLRVLKLAPPTQKALKLGHISLGHAKVLAGIQKVEDQVSTLDHIMTKGLSVRATEDFLHNKNKPATQSTNKNTAKILPEVREMQDELSERLGHKVLISRNTEGKGVIKINFKNDNELNDLVDLLLK